MEEVKIDLCAQSNFINVTEEGCPTSAASSAFTDASPIQPEMKTESFQSGSSRTPNPPHQRALSTVKLTKEQKEAERLAREKVRAEIKAKKEKEALQKEKERAELKAKRMAESVRKEKERAELKAKKEAEKLRKEQEQREKQQKRELEMKERREKKEREDLEKKERKEKREAEKKKKEDEKRLKEEEKKKKLEEKEQQKEEKLRKEEQAKMKFRAFFTKVDKPVKKDVSTDHSILTPFSIKDGMRLAIPPRVPLQDTSLFDNLLQAQDACVDYLHTCKSKPRGSCTPRAICSPPEPMEVDDDDSCHDKDKQEKQQFKLLQFHQNYRPAYYGTWTKSRGRINPRNPFRMDTNLLDYSIDSDEEWEEEEPGESLSDSEGEDKEVVEGEEEDEDDGFFVPHGYLSEDEGDNSDDEKGLGLEDSNDPQERKNSQLAKAKAWEAEFARKCQPLNMKVIGPIWPHPPASRSSSPNENVPCNETFLAQFAAVALVSLPIPHPVATKGEASSESSLDCNTVPGSGNTGESAKQAVPEEAMPDLIRFVHKNSMGMTKIIHLFRAHWGSKVRGSSQDPVTNSNDVPVVTNGQTPHKTSQRHCMMAVTPKRSKTLTDFGALEVSSGISKRQLERKVQAIAVKEIRPPSTKGLFYVHADILHEYGMDEENLVALVSDSSSPLLIGADVAKIKDVVPPDPHIKQKKKATGNMQSLFHFMKTPKSSVGSKGGNINGSSLGKHPNEATESDDLFIVKVTPPHEENMAKEPPAKKLHLDICKPSALTNSESISTT